MDDVALCNARRAARGRVIALYKSLERPNWREVGRQLGENAGTCAGIAKGTRQASLKLLEKLDLLPHLALAPVCPKCGEVHVTKTCQAGRKRKPKTTAYRWMGSILRRPEGSDQI